MTEPGEATAADLAPEVKPEMIQDLGVADEDADVIAGGGCTRQPQ